MINPATGSYIDELDYLIQQGKLTNHPQGRYTMTVLTPDSMRQMANNLIELFGYQYVSTNKIQAIKKLREYTGAGLRESKIAIEWAIDQPFCTDERTRNVVVASLKTVDRMRNALNDWNEHLRTELNTFNEPDVGTIITWSTWDSEDEEYTNFLATRSPLGWQVPGLVGLFTWAQLQDRYPALVNGYYPMVMGLYTYTTPEPPF